MQRGQIIKELRKNAKLTQLQLSILACVKPIQISQIENGYVNSGRAFISVCEALQMPFELVMLESRIRSHHLNYPKKIVELFNDLDNLNINDKKNKS